jgi:(p)ppGpp synthase/HD superfamily hydrolase
MRAPLKKKSRSRQGSLAKRKSANQKSVKLGPRFQRAFIFASEKHAGQTRKASTIPYIAHLMGVTSLVLEFGGDEDQAIAAMLHDVVEDCAKSDATSALVWQRLWMVAQTQTPIPSRLGGRGKRITFVT